MKIVHITPKLLENLAYQDKELAQMHATLGHSVSIITSTSSENEDAVSNKNRLYSVIRLHRLLNVNYRFCVLKHLYKTLEDISPDLIFLHGQPLFSLFDIAAYKKAYPMVKVVMDCHSDFFNSGMNWISYHILHKIIYRLIIVATSKAVDCYYYITPNTKSFMQQMYHIPDTKLKFLPLGGTLDDMNFESATTIRKDIRTALNIPQDAVVIISGGKLDFIKNTHSLVKVVNTINNADVHLILFGTIDRTYEKLLKESINDNIRIHQLGWIDSKAVYDYFLASDIACFPGGQSVLWIHAICCGLPLVVQNWNHSIGYLNVQDNVIFLDNGECKSIEKALVLLINNSELRNRMHENAKSAGSSFFSYRRIAQSVIDDLEQMDKG